MNEFFVGMEDVSVAWAFRNVMVSVWEIRNRKSDFRANNWMLDSGAFSQISKHGKYLMSVDEYADRINRWSGCGNLRAAVCQDWMCEDFILKKTGKTKEEHQELTIRSYACLKERTNVYVMPVLQGFKPEDYICHLQDYGGLINDGQWVGVGSVCQRNGNPDAIEDVLLAIKAERPDLRLHGFGLKLQAIERATVRELLHSSDSMAWSAAGRRNNDAHDPRLALKYAAKVQSLTDAPSFVQDQLFGWHL